MSGSNGQLVRRLIEDVINGGRLEGLDALFTDEMAREAAGWIGPVQEAFPDVRMTIVELVAEGETVVGRFRCSATHRGRGAVTPRPGVASRTSTRSTSSGSPTGASMRPGASRTRSTGCANSAYRRDDGAPAVGRMRAGTVSP